jgi:hypothetical protein
LGWQLAGFLQVGPTSKVQGLGGALAGIVVDVGVPVAANLPNILSDYDSTDSFTPAQQLLPLANMNPTLLIGDIVERDSSTTKPAQFPSAQTPSGFPAHKRRWKQSAFKQQRAGEKAADRPVSERKDDGASRTNSKEANHHSQPSFEEMERRRIDSENQQKISAMTPQDIAQAQQDLMSGLNPALVQRLLQRANLDEKIEPSPFDLPQEKASEEATQPKTQPEPQQQQRPTPEIRINDAATTDGADSKPKPRSTKNIAEDYNEDEEPAQIPQDLFPVSDLTKESTHFPAPPTVPDLDPSDPNFLENLHEKYFPDLPADPSKLAWMAPIPTEGSVADKESAYYPHPEIAVSALRFDFRGRFLSPRVSRSISSAKGLHHHGEAPEAAGYTVAELAMLARSAVPAQRCMAFQTLGRIMYRLGRGEWGKGENDHIAMGVWNAIKKGKALETLNAAAMVEGGHRGSQAYATEALWLFEKGGWKERFKGR